MTFASKARYFPFIVKMKKQYKMFSTDGKMQISAERDAHVGTRVDLAAMLGLLVSTFNTTVNKWSEIEKRHL
jgi:hypothetical protein